NLPDGQQAGKDVLKVIATVDPPPPYELLTLPPLDKPIPSETERGGVTRSASPLGELLAAAAADRPTRSLSTGGQPTPGGAGAPRAVGGGVPGPPKAGTPPTPRTPPKLSQGPTSRPPRPNPAAAVPPPPSIGTRTGVVHDQGEKDCEG